MVRPRKYQVRWAQGAKRDVESIAQYIARESQDRGDRGRDAIVKAAERLSVHPSRGRIVPELHDVGVDLWRELILDRFRVVYRIDAKRVVIGAVLDGRRDIEHVLLERMLGL